ncbi:hypothetical protein [Streptomyces sp. MAI_2237]
MVQLVPDTRFVPGRQDSALRGNVSLGERTYEEQRAAQHEDRLDNLTTGSGLAVYGLVGVTIVCCGLRRRTA